MSARVVVVYSGWPVVSINDFLETVVENEFGDGNHFALARTVYRKVTKKSTDPAAKPVKVPEETNRTLYLMSDALFNWFQSQKPDQKLDFRVKPYELHEYDKAQTGFQSHVLRVTLPPQLNASDCQQQLAALFEPFTAFGLLANSSFNVKVWVASRTKDVHNGVAYVNFNDSVPDSVVNYVRLMLHDQDWDLTYAKADVDKPYRVRCWWAEVKKQKTKAEAKGETKVEAAK